MHGLLGAGDWVSEERTGPVTALCCDECDGGAEMVERRWQNPRRFGDLAGGSKRTGQVTLYILRVTIVSTRARVPGNGTRFLDLVLDGRRTRKRHSVLSSTFGTRRHLLVCWQSWSRGVGRGGQHTPVLIRDNGPSQSFGVLGPVCTLYRTWGLGALIQGYEAGTRCCRDTIHPVLLRVAARDFPFPLP